MDNIRIPPGQISQFKSDLTQFDSLFFSSKFGKGKTTFLKYFFEKQEKEYLVISLNPVLYSVNSNTDVFKLIEVDIASELLRNLEKNLTISEEYIYAEIIKNRSEDIAGYIFELFEKLGKPLHKGILKLIKSIHEVKQRSKDEFSYLAEGNYGAVRYYLDLKEEQLPERGNLFSGVISSVLSEDERVKVLIIDDLDRLDPDHLFRLLNIFSNSFYEDSNGDGAHKRLGFNKIILVGHYDNIQGVFHHKFGEKVDFDGYFNKFHDKIFNFDYSTEALVFLEKNLQIDIDLNKWEEGKLNQQRLDTIKQIIVEITYILFERNYIDWRTLSKKIAENPISERHYPNYLRKGSISPIAMVLFYLSDIMHTPQNLLSAFNQLMKFSEFHQMQLHNPKNCHFIFDLMIPLPCYNSCLGSLPLEENKPQTITIKFNEIDYRITTKLTSTHGYSELLAKRDDRHASETTIYRGTTKTSPDSMNFYEIWGLFLYDTLEKVPYLFRLI